MRGPGVSVIVLQLFVSLALVAFSLGLLAISLRQKDHEHADRLALSPLEEDANARPSKDP
jgi:hypothetical protein